MPSPARRGTRTPRGAGAVAGWRVRTTSRRRRGAPARRRPAGAASARVWRPTSRRSRHRAGRWPPTCLPRSGSLSNGVSRCSRLFTAHVNAAPEDVTSVPNSGLARMFDHGAGVSWSWLQRDDVLAAVLAEPAETVGHHAAVARRPVRWRPPRTPATVAGTSGAAAPATVTGDRAVRRVRRGHRRAPRAPPRCSEARSAGDRASARRRNTPPGRSRQAPHDPPAISAVRLSCTWSR